MKLKSIRLVGFKSFADETTIELQDSITCIVGPNGCGKSNILDALRWVLGEKSARGLRGQQMEDLIFLGSSIRKAAGMAEVEICFDNHDRSLGIDRDEVLISRRLYVSSASEYYIDSKRTSRRELEKILLDTGVGKNAYSIIEQGKISEVLQASPEMRRGLLDETAGISRFKMERQETLQRLKETEENLLRLTDIFRSKQKEIEKLEGQARQTQKYLKLKEEFDKHDRRFRYLELQELHRKSVQAEEKLRLLLNKREESLGQSREWERQKQKAEQSNRSRLEKAHKLDRSYHQNLAALKSLEKRQAWLSKEQKERQLRIQELDKHCQREEKKHRDIEKQHNEAQQLQLNLKTDLDKLKRQSEDIQKNLGNLQAELEANKKDEKDSQASIQKKEKEHQILLKDLKDVAHELLLELEEKRKKLQGSKNLQDELKEKIQNKLKANIQDIKSLRKDLEKTLKEKLEEEKMEQKELEQVMQRLKEFSLANVLASAESILDDFQNYESLAADFRSFFLDPSGLMGRKETLDQKMLKLTEDIEKLKKHIHELQRKRNGCLNTIESNKNKKQEVDLHIRDYEVRQESHIESQKNTEKLLKESTESLQYFRSERKLQESSLKEIQKEGRESGKEQGLIQKQVKEKEAELKRLGPEIDKGKEEIERLSQKIQKVRENSENVLPQISKQERVTEQLRMQCSQNEESLYNDFQIKYTDLKKECTDLELNKQKEESGLRRLQKEIQDIGAFNALAIEELEKSQESLDILQKQRKDIEEARKNILDALKEIDKKSKESFQETFQTVQANFEKVFAQLFDGGRAYLKLSDPEDILNSGIDIIAQPPGKKNTSVALLSGGEQGMTALALIFSLYLVRPSPFCFLDEVDAPLDDANVKRFLKMLTGYAPHTQFLVITHNKLTMSHAQAIFGVTQEEAGVSQLVAVRLVEKKLQSA